MFSTNIIILNFNTKNFLIEKIFKIENCCNPKKPGISYIDSIFYDFYPEENFLDELEVDKVNYGKTALFLATSGFDYRIRLYDFFLQDKTPDYLGLIYNGSDNLIHKIKFHQEKNTKNLYLFVGSDQKIFNIYNIA